MRDTRRTPAALVAVFASVAVILAGIGTYGVLAYAVAQRRREIGGRMAVGATRYQIGYQFFCFGFRLFVIGTLVGCVGAWATGRAMQSVVFEIPTFHVPTILVTVLVMSLVTLFAALFPAIRAARTAPYAAMRDD